MSLQPDPTQQPIVSLQRSIRDYSHLQPNEKTTSRITLSFCGSIC